ncbi:MAG: hypothetical protein IJI73_01155 [Kiritimatiellae bacterium]|nr:hypothetical protein [Kiritimatiellia bacterium]
MSPAVAEAALAALSSRLGLPLAFDAEHRGYSADSDGDAHAASAAGPAGLDFIHV